MGGCFSSSPSRNKKNESKGLSAAYQIAIPVPAATVWAVVLDVEHWPDFVDWIESTELLSRTQPTSRTSNNRSGDDGDEDQQGVRLKVGFKWKEMRRMDRKSTKLTTQIKTVVKLEDNNDNKKPGEFSKSLGYLIAFPEENFDANFTNTNTLTVQSVDDKNNDNSSSSSCVLILSLAFAATGLGVPCHGLCTGCFMSCVESYCMQELEDFAREAQKRHAAATATSDVK